MSIIEGLDVIGLPSAFVFGLLIGSFLNACIYRMPRDIPISQGRSKCPRCKRLIRWYCNIPVLSYILLGGRCQRCHKAISVQYPLVELANAILYVLLWFKFGATPEFLLYALFCSALLTGSVIDLYHQILPDEITLGGLGIGILASLVTGYVSWKSSVLGAFVGGGCFFAIAYLYAVVTDREGLGGGDVKLLAMLGAWLGLPSLLPIIILSSAVGSLVGVALMLRYGKNLQTAIPFGPFLAGGAILYLFFDRTFDTFLLP